MAKSSKKSMRKFASSGALQKTIQARRKHQQIRKKVEKKGAAKRQGAKGKGREDVNEAEGADVEEADDEVEAGSSKCVALSRLDNVFLRKPGSRECLWTTFSAEALWVAMQRTQRYAYSKLVSDML